MSPVDAGPPIATVNPVNGELLQLFEPYDAAGVEHGREREGGPAQAGRRHLVRVLDRERPGGKQRPRAAVDGKRASPLTSPIVV